MLSSVMPTGSPRRGNPFFNSHALMYRTQTRFFFKQRDKFEYLSQQVLTDEEYDAASGSGTEA